jgi:hypothetical protein
MRRAILVSVMACFVPLSAAAQSRAVAPRTQGPMTVEPIHSGFLVAPDFKITEVDRKTSGLVGGYAGWATDDTFFVGAGGYWLANTNRNDPEMAYGGLVVQWLALKSGRVGVGVKGLFGGGEATVSDNITITPRVPEFRGENGRVVAPAPALVQRVRFREGFVIAEPEALLSVRLSKQVRLTAGAGYRFTGTDRRSIGGDRLDGATGSLALQIGGGS